MAASNRVIVDGAALARELREEAAQRFAAFSSQRPDPPSVAIVQIGANPASALYTKQLVRAFALVGVTVDLHDLPGDVSLDEAAGLIRTLSSGRSPHGIQIQTPLPPQIPIARLLEGLAPHKDLDGAHPLNAGTLAQGSPGIVPATPRAGMEILLRHGVRLAGARAVVVGRSATVGRPMALMLLQRDATVTICHSRTENLARVVRWADVVAVAIGRPGLIKADMIQPGAAVIDFGTNVVDGKTVGDVEPEARARASLFTPVPGGVGPVTTAMLLHNALSLYERSLEDHV